MFAQELCALCLHPDPEVEQTLRQFAKDSKRLYFLGAPSDESTILRTIWEEGVNLVFLDFLQVSKELVGQLKLLPLTPRLVGVSSSAEGAVQAFEAAALDFLPMPLEKGRFQKMLLRTDAASGGGHNGAPGALEAAIFVRTNSKYIKIPIDSIDWIEAVGDYANIYTRKRRFTVHSTMKMLEKRLPGELFLRVHRSYIVRLTSIQELEDNTICVNNDTFIPIGKSFRQRLFNVLNVI